MTFTMFASPYIDNKCELEVLAAYHFRVHSIRTGCDSHAIDHDDWILSQQYTFLTGGNEFQACVEFFH